MKLLVIKKGPLIAYYSVEEYFIHVVVNLKLDFYSPYEYSNHFQDVTKFSPAHFGPAKINIFLIESESYVIHNSTSI